MSGIGIVIAIVGLSVLILVHEVGHFLVGKLMKLKVLELMLGLPLGPKIAAVRRGETIYGVSAVLFGGYVKFAELLSLLDLKIYAVETESPAATAGFQGGEIIKAVDGRTVEEWLPLYKMMADRKEPAAVTVAGNNGERVINCRHQDLTGLVISRDRRLRYQDINRTFDYQSRWRQALIIFAGPAMNLLLALALLVSVGLIGLPAPTTRLQRVLPGSPAAAAGIKAGDEVISIAGRRVKKWSELTVQVKRHAGRRVIVVVKRRGRLKEYAVKLRYRSKRGRLGVMAALAPQPLPPATALKNALIYIWHTIILIINFFGLLVSVPRKVLPMIRSPIGIVKETAPIAQRSFITYLTTLASLSIAIGIFNLLPLPPLDGGRIFISGIEGIRRRPLSRQAMILANAVGFSLLLMLMTYAVVGDIFRKAIPPGG